MTAHQPLVIDAGKSARPPHPLREFRRRQLVWDAANNCRRSMRLTDVPEVYGIATTTWHCWEKWPGEPGFRRPDEGNMRLLFRITKGEVTPNIYYPVESWAAELGAAEPSEADR